MKYTVCYDTNLTLTHQSCKTCEHILDIPKAKVNTFNTEICLLKRMIETHTPSILNAKKYIPLST